MMDRIQRIFASLGVMGIVILALGLLCPESPANYFRFHVWDLSHILVYGGTSTMAVFFGAFIVTLIWSK